MQIGVAFQTWKKKYITNLKIKERKKEKKEERKKKQMLIASASKFRM